MQIVIPMSGFGERFRAAGHTVPKPLIEVEGKPIIAHVIDMFPGEHNFLFICNKEHQAFGIEKVIKSCCPSGKVVFIEPHKLGPVYAVSQVYQHINDSDEVVVNYCDFTCYWNYPHFLNFVRQNNCDACLPSYSGFHPHMLGNTNYAYTQDKNGIVTDIQEKKPYTDNPLTEMASSGTFYFKNGQLLKHYFDETMRQGLKLGDEYYVSLVHKPMISDGRKVMIYEFQHFMQWGTPQDLDEYNYSSNLFKQLVGNKRSTKVFPGTLLLPMAGLGKRFSDEGYLLPKPLIPVSGTPMVVQAAKDLPTHTNQVFVLRKDLPGLEEITAVIKENFPKTDFLVLEKLTEGQACTCLEGLRGVDLEQPLTIGACDNGMIYDAAEFERLMNDPEVDVLVWAVRHHPLGVKSPKSWGWLDVDKHNNIKGVSVKVPLSDPKNDPIILGSFTFKRASDFKKTADYLIANNIRINNEFYVDSCVNVALQMGLKCKAFEVDAYLGWGTPNDLRSFEYWQSCFSKWPSHPYALEKDSRVDLAAIPVLKETFKERLCGPKGRFELG